MKSKQFEEEALAKVRRLMKCLTTQTGQRIHHFEFLERGAGLLCKARHCLAHTYVWAYNAHDNAAKAIFEYNQGELEKAVERLSFLVESTHADEMGTVSQEQRQMVVDQHSLVAMRLRKLRDELAETGDVPPPAPEPHAGASGILSRKAARAARAATRDAERQHVQRIAAAADTKRTPVPATVKPAAKRVAQKTAPKVAPKAGGRRPLTKK